MKQLSNASIKVKDGSGNWNIVPGVAGESAYEIAVRRGYQGTEAQWMNVLETERAAAIASIQSAKENALNDIPDSQEELDEAITIINHNMQKILGTPLIKRYASNTITKNTGQAIAVGDIYVEADIPQGHTFSITVVDTANANNSEDGLASVNIRYFEVGNSTHTTPSVSVWNGQPVNTELFYQAPADLYKLSIYVAAGNVKATTLQLLVNVYGLNNEALDANLAPVELKIVSRKYYVGEYFMMMGVLYRVTENIPAGGKIIPGTNVEPANIRNLINTSDNLIKNNFGLQTILIHPGHLVDTGEVNPDTVGSYRTSDWIHVNAGDILHYRLSMPGLYRFLVVADVNKVVTDSVGGSTGVEVEGVYKFNSTNLNGQEGYIRISNDMDHTLRCYAYLDPNAAGDALRYRFPQIPDYWNDALNNVRQRVLARDEALIKGDRFFFITDPHWRSQQNQVSSMLVDKLSDDFNIRLCLLGGDNIASKGENKDAGYKEITNYIHSFKNPLLKLFATAGNHDFALNNATLPNSLVYDALERHMESFCHTSGNINGAYYDNESQKIRYVQFDFHAKNGKNADTVAWAEACFNDVKQKTDSSEWTIVVMSHAYWDVDSETNSFIVNDKGSAWSDWLLDCKANGAPIAVWLVGHTHRDKYATLQKTVNENTENEATVKLLVVGTTTDNVSSTQAQEAGYSRSNNSDTEAAFDIVHLDTQNHRIYFTRVGGWFADTELQVNGEQPATGDRAFDYLNACLYEEE